MKKFLAAKNNIPVTSDINDLIRNSIYIVYSTTNGKEWTEFPKGIIPDLIFCDTQASILNPATINQEIEEGVVPFIFLSTKVKINNQSIGIVISADDYIIKQFSGTDLFRSIEKRIETDKEFGKNISKSIKKERAVLKNYEEDDRIFIDSKRKPKLIKVGDITYITSKGNDSIINLSDMPNLPIRKTLNSWENVLPINIFKRINRSTIINLKYVENISRWNRETYIIYLKDIKEPFPVSYRYAREMRAEFK
jgi:two-component system, LytTR family, response regulator